MNNLQAMEKRVVELESRLSFQDDMIVQLNEVVVELRGEISKLAVRLTAAEEKLHGVTADLVKPQSEEDPPPHY